MNSPEDEIPLPSEGVLSEKESAKQLREDSCRQYVEKIKHLDRVIESLIPFVHAPGAWHCEKCGFVLQKSTLHAQTGNISANNEPFNEQCPNDRQLMKPLTWKQMSEANYKAGAEALEREQVLRQILIETRHYSLGHGVPSEWYLKRDKALNQKHPSTT